jgi:hypothetical protein
MKKMTGLAILLVGNAGLAASIRAAQRDASQEIKQSVMK